MPKGINKQPVCCAHCGRQFSSGAGLALHMRWVDGMEHPMKGVKLAGERLVSQQAIARAAQKQFVQLHSPQTFECRHCGVVIETTPFHAKRRKYCSMDCVSASQVGRSVSDSQKEALSRAQKERYARDPRSNPFFGRTPSNYNGWGHGQFVEELGYWVRSTWERDYLLGLKAAGIEFEYESVRFDLGDVTYIPDVHLVGSDVFIEITGWDKPGKAEKRERAADLYGFVLIVEARRPTEETIRDLVDRCKEVRPQ